MGFDLSEYTPRKKTKSKTWVPQNQWEEHLKEEEKRVEQESILRERERKMRPVVEQLFEAMKNKESFEGAFVNLSTRLGFKTEEGFELILKQIQRGDFKRLSGLIINTWLNMFPDSNSRQRKIKFRRQKLQFEKNPRQLTKTKITFHGGTIAGERIFETELTKYGEEQRDIQVAIDNFVSLMKQG